MTEPVKEPIPGENQLCKCGHTRFWHANFGTSNCDKCNCDKFAEIIREREQ